MIRAVLDTNVIVSSLLSPAGVPGRIVKAWKTNAFELCLSEPLLQEIADVLSRPVIRRTARITQKQIEEFLDLLEKTSLLAPGDLPIETVIDDDPDDDVVLATAVALDADVIVSGDHHLLDIKQYRRIPIVSPRTFLDLLGEISPA